MKQKNYLTCLIILAFLYDQTVLAQTNVFPSTGPAGIGTTTPNVLSLLDIVSTSKGVLIPRMTKNQRDLIGSPAIGLLIYQINSTPGFYYYDGAAWTAVAPATANRGNAFMNFYSSAGALLKSQKLNAEGKGSIELKTDALPGGTYQYLLIVDGKIMDTKKMVTAK